MVLVGRFLGSMVTRCRQHSRISHDDRPRRSRCHGRHPPALPDVPARRTSPLTTRSTRGWTRRAGRHRRWRSASGRRCASTTCELGHAVEPDRPGRRACPTWCSPPTARPSSTAGVTARSSATRSGPPRGRAYLEWFTGPRLRPVRDADLHVNEGEGDFLTLDQRDPGRHRLPHRPRRARRGAGALRPAGRSRCSWSTRASTTWTPRCRARTTTTSPTARRRSPRGSQAVLRQLFPDAVIADEADAAVLGLNAGQRRPPRRAARAGDRPRPAARATAASSRSRSTCPSCARPAAARSAARWRSGMNRSGRAREVDR